MIKKRIFKFDRNKTLYLIKQKVIGYKLHINESGGLLGQKPKRYRKVKIPAYHYSKWYDMSRDSYIRKHGRR
jgi:hypothetical protein